ncbi:MAG: hypothetical protein HQL46_09330, partial [Gammaproteobacteria bacterium]|nr:hypothetical protein [Gammaproteobacteria bacterium]
MKNNVLSQQLAIENSEENKQRQARLQHICLQLAALGFNCDITEQNYLSVAESLLLNYGQYRRLLSEYRCPSDQRIQDFLGKYF